MKSTHWRCQTKRKNLEICLSWWLYHSWSLLFSTLVILENNNPGFPLHNTMSRNYILYIFNFITVPNTDIALEVLKNIGWIKNFINIIAHALAFRNKMSPELTRGKSNLIQPNLFTDKEIKTQIHFKIYQVHIALLWQKEGKKLIITSSKMTIVSNWK